MVEREHEGGRGILRQTLRRSLLAVAYLTAALLSSCGGPRTEVNSDTASTATRGAVAHPPATHTTQARTATQLTRPLQFTASGTLPQELEHIRLNMSLADV